MYVVLHISVRHFDIIRRWHAQSILHGPLEYDRTDNDHVISLCANWSNYQEMWQALYAYDLVSDLCFWGAKSPAELRRGASIISEEENSLASKQQLVRLSVSRE
jgi:hypothetical protein